MRTDHLTPVRFREGFGPRFLVTVDVEEEFDWSQPLARENVSVESVARLRKFQRFCEAVEVRPCYLIDFPVANSRIAQDILGKAFKAGKADLGLQLHPWVTPPHREEVNQSNSFPGNLPPALERDKIATLTRKVRDSFDTDALIYRAGRYGLGEDTASLLAEQGIAIDSSVRAYHDYSAAGGPDFGMVDPNPFWLDRDHRVMEIPLTTVFAGAFAKSGASGFRRIEKVPRLPGLAARLGLLERIPLTPEGTTAQEAMRGIDIALRQDVPILNLSFHSPSLVPGNTPYVRDSTDLDAFYDWWRAVFDHLKARNVRPTGVEDIMAAVELE